MKSSLSFVITIFALRFNSTCKKGLANIVSLTLLSDLALEYNGHNQRHKDVKTERKSMIN